MAKDHLILPLHGLRGLAAATVVLGHFEIIPGAASLGVVLFFVLSGFLIGKLYLSQAFNRKTVTQYAVARFARVYPLFAIVILLTGLLNHLVPSAQIFQLDPSKVGLHLILAGSAFTVWTISVEFQFYLLFLPIWFLVSRFQRRLGFLLGVFGFSAIFAIWLGNSAHRINIFGYLPIFILGVVISAIPGGGSDRRTRTTLSRLSLLLIVAYWTAYLFAPRIYDTRFIYLDPLSISICAGMLYCAIEGDDNGSVSRFLSTRFMVWLGEISFGVYLLHRHVQWGVNSLDHIVGEQFQPFLMIVSTLLLAQLANFIIERPFRTRLRRFASRI